MSDGDAGGLPCLERATGGDEIPDRGAIHDRLPDVAWRSVIARCEELGARIRAAIDGGTIPP